MHVGVWRQTQDAVTTCCAAVCHVPFNSSVFICRPTRRVIAPSLKQLQRPRGSDDVIDFRRTSAWAHQGTQTVLAIQNSKHQVKHAVDVCGAGEASQASALVLTE